MPRAVCDSMKEPKMRRTNVSKRYALSSLITSKLPKRLYKGLYSKRLQKVKRCHYLKLIGKAFFVEGCQGTYQDKDTCEAAE